MNAAKEIAKCKAKIRYASQDKADLAARAQMIAYSHVPDLKSYHCKWCDGWHHTHKK